LVVFESPDTETMPRFYCPLPLSTGAQLNLPDGAARHVQVLRLQPGDGVTLFNGEGGEYEATVTRMGRSEVQVEVGQHAGVEREASRAVHLVLGVPANERMDWLVEKATELGVASITPLVTERSVLRLSGERAQKRQVHWQAIAVAASEQCGRNRVPIIYPLQTFTDWLKSAVAKPASEPEELRYLLSLSPQSHALSHTAGSDSSVIFLSGPEGGLSSAEEAAASNCGFLPVTLGLRVLRAETAPLAALATLVALP
jgi:16S rRNA (uracil1498-N3)-methyltransferase